MRTQGQVMAAGVQNQLVSQRADADQYPFLTKIQGEHCRLGGDLQRDGFSFEWHNWITGGSVQWSRPDRLAGVELHLNIEGSGQLGCCAGARAEQCPMTAGLCCRADCPLRGVRSAGKHRFMIVAFTKGFLAEALGESDPSVHPGIRRLLSGARGRCSAVTITSMTSSHQEFVLSLRRPTVSARARTLWYRSKAMETIAEFLFPREEEIVCTRQERLARERVERVVKILRQDLAAAPTLEELARQAGCSPFYLSRTFSREMGQTISQFLRQLRMEKAAELLASGKWNVTQTAMEVGYSSVSHFSHTFCHVIGCCPNLYPLAKVPGEKCSE